MDAAGMSQVPTSPRPRSRGFSFNSNRSGGSSSRQPRESLTESPQDKARRDKIWQGSKANPNAALVESQPAVANLLEETTIQTLRGVQHKDVQGNVITDPDLSNPTRPRLERPLDTIRSFEKAIDNGYRRRTSYMKPEADQGYGSHSRRSSSFMGSGGNENGRQSQAGGYYGARDSYYGGPGGSRRQGPGPRGVSDPMLYNRPNGQHAHQPSQDTMNTNGSDTTGPWASGTDPSSENSSIDKMPNGKESVYPQNGGYGQNSFAQNGLNGHHTNGLQGSIPEEGGAYPMPQGSRSNATRPIQLGNTTNPSSHLPSSAPRPEPEKRKSWLKRRFSKQ